MKIIFLDIDGVLTHKFYENHETEDIDVSKVKLLKHIVNETGAKIVLSSSWRESIAGEKIYAYKILENVLKEHGLKIYDETPIIKSKFMGINTDITNLHISQIKNLKFDPFTRRAGEIFKWLNANKEKIDNFIILDDDDFDFEFFGYDKHLIKTDYYKGGLNEAHALKAIALLNTRKDEFNKSKTK